MAKSRSKMIPIAVFDISSSSIAGAHVLAPKGETLGAKVSVLASTRLPSEPKEDLTIERFVAGAVEQLDKCVGLLKKADNHSPEHIQVLLASPWFVSQTRSIVYSKTTDFVCTQKLIDSLVEKEITYIMEHDMERFGSIGKEGSIIEQQISQIKLNGYTTARPFGKKTKSLELFLVVTVSPKSIISQFNETLRKSYAHAVLKFTTSPYATHIITRDLLHSPTESLLIDVGEEITDIACVKNDLFLYQHSFPVGIYHFYRALASGGTTTLTEAHALVESFRLGKLSAPMTSTVQKALDEFGTFWIRSLQELIEGGQNSIKLPETMYVSVDYRFDSFFKTILQNDIFLKHTIGATTPVAVPLTHDILSEYANSLDGGHIDETIIIGSLFASRLL